MSSRKDPFKVLGIDRNNYKYEDLKVRYLELVKKFPPERRPEKFEEIRTAYDTIRNAKSPYDLMALSPVWMAKGDISKAQIIEKLEEALGIKKDKIDIKRNMMLNKLEEIINDTRD